MHDSRLDCHAHVVDALLITVVCAVCCTAVVLLQMAIVLEYMDGGTLADVLNKVCSPGRTVWLEATVCLSAFRDLTAGISTCRRPHVVVVCQGMALFCGQRELAY